MIRLAMIRGDNRDLTVSLTNAAGEPIDLDDISDITFTAMLNYDDSGDTATSIVKTLGDGIVKDDPPEAGICTVTHQPRGYGQLHLRIPPHVADQGSRGLRGRRSYRGTGIPVRVPGRSGYQRMTLAEQNHWAMILILVLLGCGYHPALGTGA